MIYDYKNKTANVRQLNNYMYAKTLSMFEYEGLPPSIPVRELERLLQIGGYAFITTAPNGKLYAFHGGLGGLPCPYGNPTEIVIANPALNFYKTLKLKTDGVLIRNDDLALGLNPLFDKCNTMLVENDINMILHGYSTRMQKLISASDDKTKDSANAYLKKVVDGEVSIVAENAMFEGVKVHGTSSDSVGVTGMVEFHQYIKSIMLGEIGLSTNFNMKKERLISAEVDQQDDSTFPYVYNMMKCRLKGVERINEMFGTDIDVDFGSVWNLKNRKLVDDVIGNGELDSQTQTNELDNLTDEHIQHIDDDDIDGDITDMELDELEDTIKELETLDDIDDEVETIIIDENLDYVETIELDTPLDEVETIELYEEITDDEVNDNTGSSETDSPDDKGSETEVVLIEDVVTDVVDIVIDEVIYNDDLDPNITNEIVNVLDDIKTSTNSEIVEDLITVNTSEDKDNATV